MLDTRAIPYIFLETRFSNLLVWGRLPSLPAKAFTQAVKPAPSAENLRPFF